VKDPSTPEELTAITELIDRWLDAQLAENPVVAAVEREVAERRWYVRITGEEKDVYSVWIQLGQRTLGYETYVMAAPEENQAEFYEHLLRRNKGFYGLAFEIGEEDAVFLAGQLGNDAIDEDELDRVLGTVYAAIERCFRPALRIGFASRMSA